MSIEEQISEAVRIAVNPLLVTIDRLEKKIDKLVEPKNETPLSNEDAAGRLGVSLSTLQRMKEDKRVGSVITRKGRLVRVCDVERYEKSQGLSP